MLEIFLAGLKKQSGKTLVARALAGTMQSLSYSTSYFKTIQTGLNDTLLDTQVINKVDCNIKTSTGYILDTPSTPFVGAYESGIKKIDIAEIFEKYKINSQMMDCCIVEGTNSVSSPICEKMTEVGIINAFKLPLILVVNPSVSKIEDVISGLNYLYFHRADVLGIIINNFDENSADMEQKYYPQILSSYTDIKILGIYPHYDNFEDTGADTLIADTLHKVNLEEIFGVKIAKLEE